uniref:Synaptotagmin-like protein 2 n=1 Tax=Knipowitschia caucasica TaxID=637954 RepID=A0AAV2JFR3_KNICA
MIDLSFLTEEEQEVILGVLKRDADLKRAEEQRVQKLQQIICDRARLKYLTGEWFYETKQLRHQERIHGSDIIWASMKHTHKPMTILELSQIVPNRPSFVSGENKEVFVPAVLCGLLQEPTPGPCNTWKDDPNPYETGPIKPMSPTKRKNPFNNQAVEDVFTELRDRPTLPQLPSENNGYEEGSGPVMSALKRLSTKMSSSKSLENLTSPTREEKEQLNKSVDDVSEFPSTTFSTTKKSSVSVPAFQLDETDSDSPLENNLSYRRNTGSSASNISLSSGMASMSSVGGSMTSIYHNDLGDVDVQGTIQFAVNYIQKLGEFHIFVVHCRDLAVGDSKKSRSDPYVKCYLVPDKTKLGKRKTSIKKKTVNPTYNEILRFKILLEVLKFQHLNVSVWHNDTFGRNSFLGEVDLDLSQWDFSNAQISEYSLKARASSAALTSTPSPTRTTDSSRGQMRVAVRFLPQTSPSKRTSRNETGEVQIWVKDCKNLPPIRGVIIDPFVKCTVLPDTSRKSRQKTRVVKRTANPMFNHTMVYDGFRSEDLKEACVELTVWDHDRLNNHYIGGVRLGLGTGKSYGVDVNWMDSTTSEASLWQRMLDSAGEWLEDVLPLRMLLMAKSMSN